MIKEALPCAFCGHHFAATAARDGARKKRRILGKREAAILLVASTARSPFYPLTQQMTVTTRERTVNRMKYLLSARRLVAKGAVIAITLPTQVVHSALHDVLRESVWLQVTARGRLLMMQGDTRSESLDTARAQALAEVTATLSEHVDVLLARYVDNLTFVLKTILEQVLGATTKVVQKQLASADAPYITASVHLARLSPSAGDEITQHFLRTQADLRTLSVAQPALMQGSSSGTHSSSCH